MLDRWLRGGTPGLEFDSQTQVGTHKHIKCTHEDVYVLIARRVDTRAYLD